MKALLNNNTISKNIFSIYTDLKPGNSTHIIFGGIDSQGIAPGDKMKYINTTSR